MKRPSLQFYPGDWQRNPKLRRCSHAEKGVWIDVMCLMHDSEEYGVLRWPLADIAQAVGCKAADLRALQARGVLKGADTGGQCEAFTYAPRHAGKDGDPVTLIPTQAGAVWYSSRMVVDEYVRQKRGNKSLYEHSPNYAPNKPPINSPKGGIGDNSDGRDIGESESDSGQNLDEQQGEKVDEQTGGVKAPTDCNDLIHDSPKGGIGEDIGSHQSNHHLMCAGASSSSSSSKERDSYRFFGDTVRLNEKDYSRLKNDYSAIPDFDADLKAADNHYTKVSEKDWFHCLPGWLNRTHQNHFGRKQASSASPRPKNAVTL